MDRRAAEDRGEPVVSIVIVHYRTPDLLAKCLAQIGAAQVVIPCEVLIVDNAPLDDAAEKVARAGGARYLCSERNVGYGRAVNRGMEAARGRYYLILNPDVEIRPGSVEALTAYLDAHPSAGLCGPKLFSPDGSLQYSTRTFYTLEIILLRRTPIGRLFPRARALREHLMQDWDHADVREVDWMLGGAIMVRREAVADVGGMDARFFLYFEDVDWCSRMHRRGWRVVYVPHAEMVHAHQRISAHGFLTRGQRMHLSSALRFWEKWSAVLYLWKKKSTQLRALATLLSDVVWLSVAFLAAYFSRYALGLLFPSWSTAKPVLALGVYARFIAFADLVAVGTFFFLGLYRSAVWRDRWREFFQLVNGVAITSLVVMASTFLFITRPLSRFTIVLFFPYSLLLVALAREALRRVVAEARERRLHLRRLAVFAPKTSIARLEERFRRHGRFGYEPVYLAHDDEARHPREGAPDPVVRRTRLLGCERRGVRLAPAAGTPRHRDPRGLHSGGGGALARGPPPGRFHGLRGHRAGRGRSAGWKLAEARGRRSLRRPAPRSRFSAASCSGDSSWQTGGCDPTADRPPRSSNRPARLPETDTPPPVYSHDEVLSCARGRASRRGELCGSLADPPCPVGGAGPRGTPGSLGCAGRAGRRVRRCL
jgi:GT2 family glycosyltransferase